MSNPLRTAEDYELFLYTLSERYDSHPNESSLQSTHPHHKHIPPDIKHHRIPAPAMSFSRPNLPTLIREIEALVESIGDKREE